MLPFVYEKEEVGIYAIVSYLGKRKYKNDKPTI
jgi:hypothetical protein